MCEQFELFRLDVTFDKRQLLKKKIVRIPTVIFV